MNVTLVSDEQQVTRAVETHCFDRTAALDLRLPLAQLDVEYGGLGT